MTKTDDKLMTKTDDKLMTKTDDKLMTKTAEMTKIKIVLECSSFELIERGVIII